LIVSSLSRDNLPCTKRIEKRARQATNDEKNNNMGGSRYRKEILNADPIVDQQAIAAKANI